MGLRGPQKTPTKILEQRGSWRADTRGGEPEVRKGEMICPDWLDEDAHIEWNRIVPELEAMGIIGVTDITVIIGYCESWARYKSAVEKVQRTGELIQSKKDGEIRRNPMMFVLKDSREAMLKFARELGLSPASRASVSVDSNTESSDPLTEMLKRRGDLN